MNLADILLPFAVGCGGIVLGSVLNYYILKRLFRGQVTSVIGIFEGTKTGKEVADMIHKVSEWSKDDTAKGLLEKVVHLLDRVNRFADSEDAKEIASKLIRALDDLIGDDGN